MLATRWSFDSVIEYLPFKTPNIVTDRKFFRALSCDYDGHVMLTCDPDKPNLTDSGICYNLLKKFQPQAQLVWCLENYSENPRILTVLRSKIGRINFATSMEMLVRKYRIEAVEIDWQVLEILGYSPAPMCYINTGNLELSERMKDFFLQFNSKYDTAYICPSFGHVRRKYLYTSHGTFATTLCHPESALTHLRGTVEFLEKCPAAHPVVMELDTCGVEYLCNKYDDTLADQVQILSRQCILRRQTMYPRKDEVDHVNGCCLSRYGATSVISWDNDAVLRLKIDYARRKNLDILLGELHHDIYYVSKRSLYSEVCRLLIN